MLMDRRNYMNAVNPFNMLDEIERAFLNNGSTSAFKTDIRDMGDNYLLEADLPGFEKSDINLELENDMLTIKAERHSEIEDKDKNGDVIRCERSFGSFSRTFDVTGIDAENITAAYKNGVLSLTLPKQKEELPAVRNITMD